MVDRRAIALVLATAIAVPMEGVRQTYYYDPPGIPTVCFGHTGNVDKSKRYSMDECKTLLTQDMTNALNIVEKCQPNLPAPILAAFTDLTYNAGATAACDTTKSTAARMLKAKDYAGACEQLLRWSKARVAGVMVDLPGLVKRRKMERDLCVSEL